MKKVYPYLIYTGAIPFLFCSVCFIVDFHEVPLFGSIERILSVYGLIILSFLAGSHWGQQLYISKTVWGIVLAVLSNIIALCLCFGFLLLSFKMLMAMFSAAFFILIIIDYFLFKIELLSGNYFLTRFLASTIVIVSLIISGIMS